MRLEEKTTITDDVSSVVGRQQVVIDPDREKDGVDVDGGGGGGHMNYAVAAGNRRGGHVRESLPPALLGGELQPLSAGGGASTRTFNSSLRLGLRYGPSRLT